MKVALVTYLFGPEMAHGAVAAVWQLAQGLGRHGIEVVVITTHRRRRLTVHRADGITIYRFCPWNLYWIGDKDRQPIWKKIPWQLIDIWNANAFGVVLRILEQERPDLLHVHKLRGLSPSVWAAAQSAGIPVVQTCHDYELMSPEGTLSSRVGLWAWQGAWFLRWYSWIRTCLSRVVAAATAPSRYTLELLSSRGFFPNATRQVIPNSHGLTLAELDRRRRDKLTENPVNTTSVHALYLGRLEDIKGVDLLCAAFERCVARFPQLHLDIAGWGTLEPILRERYGQHAQITFHGTVLGQDKARLLSQSDVLVVPSVWPEAFGIVILEAYSYGRPSIVARSGGMPELVRQGETGFVLTPGDAQALADALCRIAEAPDTVRAMSKACFEAAQQYALESVVGQYRALYEQVLN